MTELLEDISLSATAGDSCPWVSSSLTLALPFDTRRDFLEAEHSLSTTVRWAGTGLEQNPRLGATQRAPKTTDWFAAHRLRAAIEEGQEAVEASRHRNLSSDLKVIAKLACLDEWLRVSRLADKGLVLVGLERRVFVETSPRGSGPEQSTLEQVGYVLAHFRLDGEALADPSRVVRDLHRPDREMGDSIEALAQFAGVRIRVDDAGRTASRIDGEKYNRTRDSAPWRRTFHIVFSAPRANLPKMDEGLRDHPGWGLEQLWGYRLACGLGLDRSAFRPPATARAATDHTARIGQTLVRVEQLGVAFLVPSRTNPCEADAREAALIQVLAHTRYADLAILALRQRSWLDQHADLLASLSETDDSDAAESQQTGDGPQEKLLGEIIRHEIRLMGFRNRVWFTDVPGHEDGTTVLQLLQNRLSINSLLTDLIGEQGDWAKIAQLDASRSQKERDDKAAKAQHKEEVAREKEQSRIAGWVAFLAVPGIVFSWVGVTFDSTLRLGFLALAISSLTSVGMFLVQRALARRGARTDALDNLDS